MALTDKKYSSFHGKTGSDKNSMKAKFDEGHQNVYVDNPDGGDPAIVAMIYQIGQLEEELDYLRTEISDNKDKKSMTIGIASNQAMAGDTTTITSQQAKDITNTKTDVANNTTTIKSMDTQVSTNKTNIATNVTNIDGKLTKMLGNKNQSLICVVEEDRNGDHALIFMLSIKDEKSGKTIRKTATLQFK